MLTTRVTATISLASLCLQMHFPSGCFIYVLAVPISGCSPAKLLQAWSSLSRSPRATQDGLLNKGSQTFPKTTSKHKLFFSLFLLSTHRLKTENSSLLLKLSLLTKSQKRSTLFFFPVLSTNTLKQCHSFAKDSVLFHLFFFFNCEN